MILIDATLTEQDLLPSIRRMWDMSAPRIVAVERDWGPGSGSPVYTVEGLYTARGWTEWTQGFQFGSALLQFDATGDPRFLEIGRAAVRERMAPHVTHFGVHDHGFNNVSTYGALWRLYREGRVPSCDAEAAFLEMALRCSGAVQARRWTRIADGGFIHSFNGQHSLFADTMRTLRSLALAHSLGHVMLDEHDEPVSLLGRLVEHAHATARYAVFYGAGRDIYDSEPGRVAHESIFNVTDGRYRCPGTQQGYSPFSTWTRGLAWVLLGFAEELEYLASLPDADLDPHGGRERVVAPMVRAAIATCGFYVRNTPTDGVPYWDTGAPGLARIDRYLDRPADPLNPCEPVDSSAAAIAAQGLIRMGRYLGEGSGEGRQFRAAGLTVARTLLSEPYLSTRPGHQGLLLHSVYHRPNGWDHVPAWASVPCGESSMWGDYHLRELALLLMRLAEGACYRFSGPPTQVAATEARQAPTHVGRNREFASPTTEAAGAAHQARRCVGPNRDRGSDDAHSQGSSG
ncbi:MAG TPA: glycoside hydrolase family 88 protein [Chthonomonadales bacterium]|nr:glycoside hydrolase family 88 protein [Chthonomonadales bacterium]